MKLIKNMIGLLLVATSVAGQSVNFDTTGKSWNEVLAKANTSQKPIFVDVCTSWCGPCKWMDKNVFNQASVASLLNSQFVNVKIDAEKGYGKEFAARNNVHGFPTFLFFNPGGDLALAGNGSTPAASMIQIIRQALSNIKDNVSLRAMQQQITANNYSKTDIKNYIKRLSALNQPNATLIEAYLDVLPEDSIYSPEILTLVSAGYFGRMPLQGKATKVLLNAYAQYPVKSWEMMSPWNILKSRLLEYTDSAGKQGDTTWLNEILAVSDQLNTSAWAKDREQLYLLCRYYLAANDSTNFTKTAHDFADKYIININTDTLTARNQLAFRDALNVKFGKCTNKPSEQELSGFKKGFLHETRLINEELFEIVYGYHQYFNTSLKQHALIVQEWIDKSIGLYKKNGVYVNENLIKQQENAFHRLLN